MSTSTHSPAQFTPVAAILAWLWPGLGHISLGRRKRGSLVMFGVLFLFAAGVLIGGVDVVDRKDDRLWFWAQALCGPIAFAVDFTNQNLVKTGHIGEILVLGHRDRSGTMIPPASDKKSLGHVNEIGTLYAALAGLMHLIAIVDALYDLPRKPVDHRRRSTDP